MERTPTEGSVFIYATPIEVPPLELNMYDPFDDFPARLDLVDY